MKRFRNLNIINVKTHQFKTQSKGVSVSHAFETAKITVFDPVLCKTPDAPLQNELLGQTFVQLILLVTVILCKLLLFCSLFVSFFAIKCL